MKLSFPHIVCVVAAGALSACTAITAPNNPVKDKQYVSLVNSLTWTNALTGKRDGSRSSTPLAAGHKELFPLAQLKQCEGAGPCAWGVMNAQRSVTSVKYVPDGVILGLALTVDVKRRQEMREGNFSAAMAIPSDVPALGATKQVERSLTLKYGQVEHIDFDYGVGFDVCVLRYDAAGRALDTCAIAHI